MPIAHVSLVVSDLDSAVDFYTKALQPLGYKVYMKLPNVVGFSIREPDFWIAQQNEEAKDREKDLGDQVKTVYTKTHIAFCGSSRAAVRKFHAAALKAGATCNGPPGLRPQYTPGYYAAFVHDADGNNVECLCFSPWWFVALQYSAYVGAAGVVGLAWWAGKQGWF